MDFNAQEKKRFPFVPSSGLHSVKETSVGIYLTSEIGNVKAFFDLAEDNAYLKDAFPHHKTVYDAGSSFEPDKEYDESRIEQIAGFVFARLGENEVPTRLFQGINEDSIRRLFSFHEMAYTRWAAFKENLLDTLDSFKPLIEDLVVEGIALTYIDEYSWNEDSDIDYNLIFKKDNKYMPSVFFEKGNTDADLVSTIRLEKEGLDFYVRLGIESITKPEGKRLRIFHNAVYTGQEEALGETLAGGVSSKFSHVIQVAHELNKSLLKDLLLPEVIDMIHMN
jgi:uncharacterized protein (TIGR04255 family)